jgi:parvulin-like peptidyl-prolyl isomerase
MPRSSLMKHVAAVLLTVLIGLVGARALAAQGKSTIIERVLVRVNGEIYTQSQLTQHQTDALRSKNKQPRNVPDAELLKLLQEVTPEVLVNAVDELLIAQYGRELGASFSDDEFKKAVESIKKENNLDDEKLKQALIQEGLTLDELRSNFEKAFLLRAVQTREILPRMRITEEEMRQYYTAHTPELMTPETVTLRELSVLVPALGVPGQSPLRPDELAAAKAEIDGIRARAVGGEDFAALVKELSDAPTKANGGLVGPVNVQDINPVLKDLIGKLRPGEISEPVQLGRGYQIFKLEAREATILQPFDKVRDKIELAIRDERLEGEMKKLRARLRAQAVIEWKDANLKTLYERQLSTAPPS